MYRISTTAIFLSMFLSVFCSCTQSDVERIESEAYMQVLQEVQKMQSNSEILSKIGRGALIDLDGDEMNELLLFYEYPENYLTFEVWKCEEGNAIRLATASDLNCLAGAGTGGITLVEYNEKEYIAFWMCNSEPNPPGVVVDFDCSLWSIQDGVLVNPLRMGAMYQKEEEITQVISNYGIANGRELTVNECEEFVRVVKEKPKREFCRAPIPTDDCAIGLSLEELLLTL